MFFKSRLFKFLLPLAAYLLFAFQWLYNYKLVWYANIPEETQYLRGTNMGFYMMYAWLQLVSFLLFVILGIIYLVKDPVPAFIRYSLAGILFFSAYFAWHYSTMLRGWHGTGLLQFGNLVLFAVSIFKLSRQ
jgi:hypothetical protein